MMTFIRGFSVFLQLFIVLLTMSCIHMHHPYSHTLRTQLQFSAPWSHDGYQDTEALFWHSQDTLYFQFDGVDTSLVALDQDNFHHGIGSSDRVELFLSTDTLLSDYYGMEIGYDNRILSFHGKHYREIDYQWEWPREQLTALSTVDSTGYSCTGKVSLQYLKSLGLIDQQSRLFIGVFRADYHEIGNPNRVTWITHQDPQTPTPDFHTSSAFFYYQL